MIQLSLLILMVTNTVHGLGLDRKSSIKNRLANLEKVMGELSEEVKTLRNEVSRTKQIP